MQTQTIARVSGYRGIFKLPHQAFEKAIFRITRVGILEEQAHLSHADALQLTRARKRRIPECHETLQQETSDGTAMGWRLAFGVQELRVSLHLAEDPASELQCALASANVLLVGPTCAAHGYQAAYTAAQPARRSRAERTPGQRAAH